MKCPNCGFSIPTGYHCNNCGVDAYVFAKSRQASVRLYNQALEKANASDLSGAIEELEQSLVFDKNNTSARNLLGLIYCETGRIADALKHWIISTSYKKDHNPAQNYIEALQKNAREMEKYNDAVRLYNQALQYLKQGSDDLAIIQLKKSLDFNPGFIDAYNLMILCCLMEKNYKRARQFVDVVLKKDVNNPAAMRYAAILSDQGITSGKQPKPSKTKQGNNQKVSVLKTDSNPPLPRYKRAEKKGAKVLERRDLIAFGAGILVTAIVLLVLVVPAINDAKDKKIETLQAQVDSFTGETNMTPEEVLEMRTRLETLENENKQLRSEETKQANLELLETAVSQMTDGDYESCVTTLDSIETVGFSDEDLAKYNSVKSTAYPKAADSYYTKGKSAFLSNLYDEAKINLETAMKYTNGENFVDDILYYLGMIAMENDDMETAKSYFQQVINDYPDSNQLENTQLAMEQIPDA